MGTFAKTFRDFIRYLEEKYTEKLLFHPQWLLFCSERGVNSNEPTVTSILSFLILLYNQGIGYSQINKARSASTALFLDVQIGKLTMISRFVHGVKNLTKYHSQNTPVYGTPKNYYYIMQTGKLLHLLC